MRSPQKGGREGGFLENLWKDGLQGVPASLRTCQREVSTGMNHRLKYDWTLGALAWSFRLDCNYGWLVLGFAYVLEERLSGGVPS